MVRATALMTVAQLYGSQDYGGGGAGRRLAAAGWGGVGWGGVCGLGVGGDAGVLRRASWRLGGGWWVGVPLSRLRSACGPSWGGPARQE